MTSALLAQARIDKTGRSVPYDWVTRSVTTDENPTWTASDVVMEPLWLETPESYANAIHEFSERSQEVYLLCGAHYRGLAGLLKQPEITSSNGSLTTLGQTIPSDPSLGIVTVIDLLHDDDYGSKDIAETRQLGTPGDYPKGKQISHRCSQLVFLKGYQSPDWIKTLGATLLVDPEFWRCHLAFLQSKNFYDLPTLPSSSYGNVQLRVTTIFKRNKITTPKAVETARQDAASKIRKHWSKLVQTNTPGASMVRRLDVHDERFFTVEQYISCSMVNKNNGWAILIWLDAGNPLKTEVTDFWVEGHAHGDTFAECWPTIQHSSDTVLRRAERHARDGHTSASRPGRKVHQFGITQSAALLPLEYGRNLDITSMRLAPLYALSDVFRLAASSSNQYANFLRSRIEEVIQNVKKSCNETLCLEDLRFTKEILDDYLDYLQEIIAFLEIGYGSWILSNTSHDDKGGTGTPDKSAIDLTARTREEFLKDFTCVQRRMQTLARRCLESTDIILNAAMLRESQKAIFQAEEVKQLTMVAFIYAPLSFACSVCGMQYFPQNVIVGLIVFFAILAVAFLLPTAAWYFISDSIARRVKRGRS